MLFKTIVLSALAATAAAKPIKPCKPHPVSTKAATTAPEATGTATGPYVPPTETLSTAVTTGTVKDEDKPTSTSEAEKPTSTGDAGKGTTAAESSAAETTAPAGTTTAAAETTSAAAETTSAAEETTAAVTSKDTNEVVTTTGKLPEPTIIPGNPAPVGTLLANCKDPNHIAITFDDGPYQWTNQILDMLDAADMKATFFFNGANWGSIFDHAAAVQRVANSGHQFGSHTWSHLDLGAATTTDANVREQMIKLEEATLQITGLAPTWVRLPYLGIKASSVAVLKELGYKIADVSIDTKDYELQDTPDVAVTNYKNGRAAGGTVVLAHEVQAKTVSDILPGIIAAIQEEQRQNPAVKAVTIGECFGESGPQDWYRTTPRS